MTRRFYLPFVILFSVVLFGVVLRVMLVNVKVLISHDEAISYLAATANQGEYYQVRHERVYPYGQWVEVSEWKRFFQPDKPFAFRQIATDLANYDIHPPLFFWLLHLFTLVFGVAAWVGPGLNTLLFIISAIGLFGLANALLKNQLEAAVVVVIWAVSPALLTVTSEARQYELFGTCTILFVWVIISYANTPHPSKWWRLVLISLVTAAGALSHFHFALVVLGSILIFWLPLFKKERKQFALGVVAIVTGYGLFFLLHPHFLRSFQSLAEQQQLQVEYYNTGLDFMRRLYNVIGTYTSFWVYGEIGQALIFCLWLSFVIWIGIYFFRSRQKLIAGIKQTDLTGIEAFYMFLWLAGITVGLYLLLITPINGMETRHMSAIWSFYAFLPILLARFLKKSSYRTGFLAGVCVMVTLSSIATVVSKHTQSKNIETAIRLAEVDKILADSVDRGILPRFFFYAPNESLMLAADQDFLLDHQELWLPQMETGDIYINDLSYANTEENQQAILLRLQQEFVITTDERIQFGTGTAFMLAPSAPPK